MSATASSHVWLRPLLDQSDQWFLDTAILAVDRAITEGISLSEGGYYSLFSQVAKSIHGDRIADAEKRLSELDTLWRMSLPGTGEPAPCASDAACERWQPEMTAAFYVGIALALKWRG